MKVKCFIDLHSCACRISAKDARLAVKAGDLVEVQRWSEGAQPDKVDYQVVIYRLPQTDSNALFEWCLVLFT